MSLEAITDQRGKYTIVGVPCWMKVSLNAVTISTPAKSKYIGVVWLEENESRPTMVSRIGDANPIAAKLAARFQKNRLDSKLLGFPIMVILSDKSKIVADFVNANFVDYESKREVASYLQFVVTRDKANLKASDTDFLKEHNWQIPVEGRVFACVLDATGVEEGRLEVNVTEKEAGEKVAKRITRGGSFGIPFFAIFDCEEVLVIDSDSPLGNVGFSSGYEGSKHLRKMLLATRGSLTDADVEQLVARLADE